MKARIILALTACVACLVMLVGCMPMNTQAVTDSTTQNRQYMASVSTIMGTLEGNLEDFSAAIQSGDSVSAASKAKAVDKAVADLKALEVPEGMQEIHDQYVTAAEELQTAFNGYVSLYEKVQSSGSASGYDSELAEIQSHYDAGIEALKAADEAAAAA